VSVALLTGVIFGLVTREIGIRVALGATTGTLIALVVRQGMVITVCGLSVGLAGVLVANRLIATLLLGLHSSDLMTIAVGAGLLTAVALMACYVPARRGARVDPLVALRANEERHVSPTSDGQFHRWTLPRSPCNPTWPTCP
jgi:ABC-type antimicrobial peptide transport system permease subunit